MRGARLHETNVDLAAKVPQISTCDRCLFAGLLRGILPFFFLAKYEFCDIVLDHSYLLSLQGGRNLWNLPALDRQLFPIRCFLEGAAHEANYRDNI